MWVFLGEFWGEERVGRKNYIAYSAIRPNKSMHAEFQVNPCSGLARKEARTDKQTDRQTDRQTNRQTDRQSKLLCRLAVD